MLIGSVSLACLLVGTWLLWKQAPFHRLLLRIVRAVYRGRPVRVLPESGPRFIVLVPAHNEEGGLPATLQSLAELAYPRELYEVLVIADNCSDQTARVAREAGVSVLERQHQTKKSKGYALAYALEEIAARSEQPAAVVVIDADTRVDPGLLSCFAAELQRGHAWIQGYYSVSNPDDNLKTSMLHYAFALFNGIWLLGQDRLGMGSALRGNGMCFAWAGLQRCPWQAYGLAEDLEFSWHLRLKGEKVRFAPDARVFGEMIGGEARAAASQRQRWEHGRRSLAETFGPGLAAAPFAADTRRLLEADLRMPPLSRYVSGLGLTFLLLTVAGALSSGFLQALSLILAAGLGLLILNFALYLLSPFLFLALPLRYALSLAQAPFYMLWKLRLSRRGAPEAWQRATRKHENP